MRGSAVQSTIVAIICVVFLVTLVVFFGWLSLLVFVAAAVIVIWTVSALTPKEHSLSKTQYEAVRLLSHDGLTLQEISPFLTKETAKMPPEKLRTHVLVSLMRQ